MKIIIRNTNIPEFIDDLMDEFPQVNFVASENPHEILQEIVDTDAIYGTLNEKEFAAAKKLRWIANPSVGFDWIMERSDIIESDVVLTPSRAPGYNPHGNALGDHVFGMILIFAHKWRNLLANQKDHHWSRGEYYNQYLEISGRTMVILAVGAIGSAIARRAKGFGMKVIGIDKNTSHIPKGVDQLWGIDRLDEALSISDWFVIAAPRTKETIGMIDKRRLNLIKKGSHVIAISRGGILDEAALLEGLKSGHIGGAGLDVFAQEPLPKDNPLWDQENVIISPHTGHVTPEMPSGHREVFIENLRRFISDRPFLYVGDKRAGY